MSPLIEFQLQQLKELTALVAERETLWHLADEAAYAAARSNERVELYLKGLRNV